MSKTPLTITVVDALDWPPLQDYRINTPGSLFPRSVRDGDDALHLTPNGPSGWYADNRTPSTSNTFGFPLSPRSPNVQQRRKSTLSTHNLPPKTPLEKQKYRLRRYTAAETRLARLPDPVALSPAQLHVAAIKFAIRSLALHIFESQQLLREATRNGTRDEVRWMVEHRVAALELLQGDLSTQLKQGVVDTALKEDDRSEANLVRFLGSAKVVPVFTRRVRRPPQSRAAAASAAERRRMVSASPMQLTTGASPIPQQTPRSEWSWETRIRAVLLYPSPKPPQLPPAQTESLHMSSRSTTETPTSLLWTSTPTSETFSPIEDPPDPDTPLTELGDIFEEDEDEEDDAFEDYPTFHHDSALSSDQPWRPSAARGKAFPVPAPPPLATDFRPDVTYGWLADPSTWASPSAWHGDGWEVPSPSHSRSSSSMMEPMSASTISPSSPYQYGYASAGYLEQTSPRSAATAPGPRTPTRDRAHTIQPSSASQSRSGFWASIPGRHRRLQSLKPVSASERESYASKSLPPVPTPTTPQSAPLLWALTPAHRKEKEKGLQFFAGLVRKATHSSSHSRVDDAAAAEHSPTFSDASSVFSFGMGHNKLRKRASGQNLRGERSLSVASVNVRG
ncbi:hypothetical protein C8F01DRAFT_1372701 [Mycena amicta]|nr:hypothetical protein C8F01DRAFT_1372701 [Mycena amicta]